MVKDLLDDFKRRNNMTNQDLYDELNMTRNQVYQCVTGRSLWSTTKVEKVLKLFDDYGYNKKSEFERLVTISNIKHLRTQYFIDDEFFVGLMNERNAINHASKE